MKNSILFNTHDWLQLQPETIKKHNVDLILEGKKWTDQKKLKP
jgi:hypothetical protein